MVNVFVSTHTARIKYIFDLIFSDILQTPVHIYDTIEDFEKSKGVKINYSETPVDNVLHLFPHGLLHQKGINDVEIDCFEWSNVPAFFAVSNSFIPFDLFAAAFYLVTRYEEYNPAKTDKHGRFIASDSVAVRNNFIDMPLVNIWTKKLAMLLAGYDKNFVYVEPKFTYLATFDIDNAWAYLHKSVFRSLLAAVNDGVHGRWASVKMRLDVLLRRLPDPYDNYDFMIDVIKKHKLESVWFFLVRCKGAYDRAVSYKNKAFAQMLLRVSKCAVVGIHPSYFSNSDPKRILYEKQQIEKITGSKVLHSRQHFLKFSLPNTYNALAAAGIDVDYTMGYPDVPGFRASIATPYWFFDVKNDLQSKIKIVPFQVMDVTLLKYLNLSGDEAFECIKNLMQNTQKAGGLFVSLWHNEMLASTEQKNIYTKMTEFAAQLQNS